MCYLSLVWKPGLPSEITNPVSPELKGIGDVITEKLYNDVIGMTTKTTNKLALQCSFLLDQLLEDVLE